MFWAILLIISGEALGISSELVGARLFSTTNGSALNIFLKVFGLMILGGGLLLAGYMLGYKNFKNIWIVSAISITAILIIEPILNFILFHQTPTKGALVGLVLGTIGLISALIF